MIRLWQIEWWKLKNYRPFMVLVMMYVLVFVLITCGGQLFLQFLKKHLKETKAGALACVVAKFPAIS